MTTPIRESNRSLLELPQGILTSEQQIVTAIEHLYRSGLPLQEALRTLEHEQLLPFVTGSRLHGEWSLCIDIAADLSYLSIVRLKESPSEDALCGDLEQISFEGDCLVRIPNPHLIFSLQGIATHAASPMHAEMAGQLFTLGRRLTRFRGTTVSWDQAVDRRVWTTNIDTVVLLHRLLASDLLERHAIRSCMEVGVGGGGISKTLLRELPNLQRLLVTDISPYALMCSKRNIAPVLAPHQQLELFLGKGIRSLSACVDLMVVNPPYIPHQTGSSESDPYRGTGLLREVVALADARLNPSNEAAMVCMAISNLAMRDFEQAVSENPRIVVQQLGAPFDAPLKILAVNENRHWLDFLVREHGLRTSPPVGIEGDFPFWHQLTTWAIRRRSSTR